MATSLSRLNPVHTLRSQFVNVKNINFPSTKGSSKWSLSFNLGNSGVTNSTEQGPSSVAHSSSSGQEIFPHLMETKGLSPHSYVPATCPYPEPDQTSQRPKPIIEDPF